MMVMGPVGRKDDQKMRGVVAKFVFRKFAQWSSPNKNLVLIRRCGVHLGDPARPGSVEFSPVRLLDVDGDMSPPREEFHDAFDGDAAASLWVDWRRELAAALRDEGDLSQHVSYLTVPEGIFPRDMAVETIKTIYKEMRKANVKEVAGLFGLGCFKRWPRHKSNKIIDARWVVTWNLIGGNVGVKCALAVRGFTAKFQDLDT